LIVPTFKNLKRKLRDLFDPPRKAKNKKLKVSWLDSFDQMHVLRGKCGGPFPIYKYMRKV
jgi:hypothetical protein